MESHSTDCTKMINERLDCSCGASSTGMGRTRKAKARKAAASEAALRAIDAIYREWELGQVEEVHRQRDAAIITREMRKGGGQ